MFWKKHCSSALALLLAPLFATAQVSGGLDTSFNHQGWRSIGAPGEIEVTMSIAVDPDGKILSLGPGYDFSTTSCFVSRVLADGSLDPSFGTGGTTHVQTGGADTEGYDVLRLADGKYLAAGRSYNGIEGDALLMRLNVDGSVDSSFGIQGFRHFDFGSEEALYRLYPMPDGRIMAFGAKADSAYWLMTARFHGDGRPDSTYGGTGFLFHNYNATETYPYEAVLQSDGKFVVFASVEINSLYPMRVFRFRDTGELDSSFATNGMYTFAPSDMYDAGGSIGVQADGKLVLLGIYEGGIEYQPIMYRLHPDGSLDSNFGLGGMALLSLPTQDNSTGKLLVLPDDKLMLGGSGEVDTASFLYFARFLPDGNLDPSFGNGGYVLHNLGAGGEGILALHMLPDGRYLGAGRYIDSASFTPDQLVVRIHGGGSVEVMEGLGKGLSVRAYPNPNSGSLRVDYQLAGLEPVSMTLMDLQGRILAQPLKGVLQSAGHHSLALDLGQFDLSAGMYVLRVESTTGTTSLRVSYQP